MNHIYSVLWNRALGRFCVASEWGRGRHRASRRRNAPARPALAAFAAAVALAWSAPAWAQAVLPQGPNLVAGSAAVSQAGTQMTVQQGSDKAILDWQSFNIAPGHQVIFQQPGAGAIALNRVVGADASAIQGALQANGQVFLVNPNGVLFGAGAQVSVGGLVASTLNLSNQDFLQSRYQFSGPGSGVPGAGIVNQGLITATGGGAVALLGGSVSNQGTIAARLGSVALAAGNQVALDFAGDGLLNVQVQQASINALVENRELIQADGGSVLMAASATDALLQTVVNNTGKVQARTVENRAGRIVLLGGFNGGTTRVAGTLDASAPDTGDGGFVDTSGAHVQIEAGARVTTLAAHGKTGTWLIDPTDFTISAGSGAQTDSGIGADTLMANLATTEMTLQTLATGSEAGDIHVNAPVSWDKNVLTLNAHGSININALMSVNGDGTLALNYGGTQGDAGAIPAPGSNLNVNAGGRIDFAKAGFDLLAVNGQGFKVIHTLDDLSGINQGLDGRYALGRDIDASATAATAEGFAPIGAVTTRFTGVFDGLGHSIRQLTINRPSTEGVGLFGFTNNAVLRNIGLVGGSTVGGNSTGALVGSLNGGSISNAYASGNVIGGSSTGGLVGRQSGSSIHNAYASGNVTGHQSTGGLVGDQSVSSINNAYASGNVKGEYGTGGLVGDQSESSISNAYASGNVTSEYGTGGLVGYQSESSISNAYASGDVTGPYNTGGLVGYQFVSSINNAYATGNVTGLSDIGGLVGYQFESSISYAYATGSVTGSAYFGGLVGNSKAGTVSASYWNAETTGQQVSIGGRARTSEQMKQLETYANWDISNQGGSNAVWRIYEGQSAPLLRSFMTAATIGGSAESTYNGTEIHDIADYEKPAQGDNSQFLGTLRYTASGKNAGSYSGKSLQLSGLYSTQQGYDISYAKDASLKITPKEITGVSGISARDRTYDTTSGVELVYGEASFAGLLEGDALRVDKAIGNMLDKNAGDGKKVNITGITLAGDDARNYTLKDDTASTTVNIAKAQIAQVTGITAENRGYNGRLDVGLSQEQAVFSGKFDGDALRIEGASGAMEDKNAGNGKKVNITGITLAGDDAGNYTLLDNTATTTVDIARAQITAVSGIGARNRTYDTTTGVELVYGEASFAGLLEGDALRVDNASGSMLDKNAGNGKKVNITGITLGGDDAGNYTLLDNTATTQIDIARAQITEVSGITARDRTYDTTTRVELVYGEASFAGLLDGDALRVDKAIGNMLDKNAGEGKKVDITGITLGGADARNYTLADTTAKAVANINQLSVEVTIAADGKIYDATTGATTHGDLGNSILEGDTVTLSTSGAFASKNAGVNKQVDVVGSLTGDDAGNYRLVYNETTTASIEARTIEARITADDKPHDGTTGATAHGMLDGVLAGDRVALRASGSFKDAAAGSAKTVVVSGTLEGVDAQNYRLVHNATATAAILAAAVELPGEPSGEHPGETSARPVGVIGEVHASLLHAGLSDHATPAGADALDQGCFSDAEAIAANPVHLQAVAGPGQAAIAGKAPVYAVVGGAANDRPCARAPY